MVIRHLIVSVVFTLRAALRMRSEFEQAVGEDTGGVEDDNGGAVTGLRSEQRLPDARRSDRPPVPPGTT